MSDMLGKGHFQWQAPGWDQVMRHDLVRATSLSGIVRDIVPLASKVVCLSAVSRSERAHHRSHGIRLTKANQPKGFEKPTGVPPVPNGDMRGKGRAR